ncbi:glycosyltransferase [Nocardiopsis xinjiangensis]|uniref:glycosyltransferase n=1 Tax=Nocardiopsis xinjiangensis TaxID=124285 RepID=UPI000A065526
MGPRHTRSGCSPTHRTSDGPPRWPPRAGRPGTPVRLRGTGRSAPAVPLGRPVGRPRRVAWRSMQFAVLDELEEALAGAAAPDLVHANSIETAVLGRIVADHHGVPLVCTIHEHAPQAEAYGNGRTRLAFNRLARGGDRAEPVLPREGTGRGGSARARPPDPARSGDPGRPARPSFRRLRAGSGPACRHMAHAWLVPRPETFTRLSDRCQS